VTLDDDDIEAIAGRIADLIAQQPPQPPRLLDARELAARLGVRRSWVYAHARRLGPVRLGDGPLAPLRFDLQAARATIATPAPSATKDSESTRRARRRTERVPADLPLIQGRSQE
jgi:hypothetical protein